MKNNGTLFTTCIKFSGTIEDLIKITILKLKTKFKK